MKLFVGLGNPGKKYITTRHNAGFLAVDRLTRQLNADDFRLSKKANALSAWADFHGEKVELLKPQTFMNKSGKSVVYIRSKHANLPIEDIYVIHDDLDLPLGSYKIQKGKGPKDHNGVISIEELLGSKDFYRIRIGVENRKTEKIPGEDYVLMKFSEDEMRIINSVIDKVVKEILTLIEPR